jgi:hypothetical protein
MAAKALDDDRIVKLTDAINAMKEERRVAYEHEQVARDKEYAERDKERAELAKARAERAKERDKERAERANAQKAHDRLLARVDSLNGYNIHRNNTLEYCVCDAIDDLMQDRLKFVLVSRTQNVKLVDIYGSPTGEVDGLMVYHHAHHGYDVVVIGEAKAHLDPAEYACAVQTYKKVRDMIAAAGVAHTDKSLPYKYRRQSAIFATLQGFKVYLAIGSPVVPATFREAGRTAGYLMVHSVDHSYKALNADQWDKLSDGTARL